MPSRLLAVCCAAGLLLGACSSSDNGDDEAAPTPAVMPAVESAETDTVDRGVDTDEPLPTPEAISDEPADLDRPPQPADSAGEATGPIDDADLELESDEGTVQIGGDAEVPDNVSASFPIPDDFEVQIATAAGEDAGFSGVTSLSIAELVTFYTEGLDAAGYEITERQEIEDTLAVYSFERGDEGGQIAISDAPGGVGSSVLVTISSGVEAFSLNLDFDLGGDN